MTKRIVATLVLAVGIVLLVVRNQWAFTEVVGVGLMVASAMIRMEHSRDPE